MSFQYHPFALFFPKMSDEERESLKRDIQANGVREPITVWQDQIVDGRNRFECCEELGITCTVDRTRLHAATEGEVLAYVVSQNLNRRHMTSGQKAAVVAELGLYQQKLYEQQAKKAKSSKKGNSPSDAIDDVLGIESGDSEDEKDKKRVVEVLAEALGTNKQYVYDAQAIKEYDPKLLEKVKDGLISISAAKKIVKGGSEKNSKATKVKNEDADDVPEEKEPTDKLGAPLTSAKQVKAFDETDWYKSARDALSYAKKILKEIKDRGAATTWLMHKEVEESIANAYRLLGQAEPYAVCPFCKDEEPCKKTEGCRGGRWVTKRMYETKPGEDK